MIGFISAMVVPVTWKLRAEPPRSTKVKCDIAETAATALAFLGLGAPSILPEHGFVNLDGLAAAAQRRQAAVAHRFANAMAHEPRGFEVTPRMRCNWFALMPFLDEQTR
jgi:hypothetical protein